MLLAYLLLWLLLLRVPGIFLSPTVEFWWSACKTAVMVAGAWVLYAWFAADWDRQRLGFATGDKGLRIARVLYGLALIPFGLAHFIYLKHDRRAGAWRAAMAWILGVFHRLGLHRGGRGGAHRCVCAAGSRALGVQIGMFTLLVWVPIVAAGSKDAFQWSETVVSAALTAGAWVVADSFCVIPSFAVDKR